MNYLHILSSTMTRIVWWCCALLFFCSIGCAQRVHVGAEILIERHLDLLSGKKIGVVCNQTSILPNGTHLVDTLLKRGITITALFAPEHGIRGTSSAGVTFQDSVDAKTGLPIFSLHGKTKKPTAAMLANIDVILFDVQDVGARFYTYASTLAYAMQAAAEQGKKIIVLDRPNPINGNDVEGPVLDTTLRSFVGMFPIPVRHGLTIGELATMIVGERWMEHISSLDFTVIPMEGWKREMWYDETGLPWVAPSPNMKTLSTATVYPGTCLFEATNVSEGRGTDHPFEYIGAPWIDGNSLVSMLNHRNIPGVRFEGIQFIPSGDSTGGSNPKHKDKKCGGVSIIVTDRSSFRALETGIALLNTIRDLYPDSLRIYQDQFNRLWGSRTLLPPSDQEVQRKAFKNNSRKYLLY